MESFVFTYAFCIVFKMNRTLLNAYRKDSFEKKMRPINRRVMDKRAWFLRG